MVLKTRCRWVTDDELVKKYHDREWGVPLHDERKLFEFLLLEGVQAGLRWPIILRKREHYRHVFDGFDAKMISRYDERKVESLMKDEGIIRNRLKINAAIWNARAYLRVQKEYGSFDAYIWQFTGGKPKVNSWRIAKEVPSRTPESDAMSMDLSKRGFAFVGPIICYAFMQAVGMVNDHTTGCFRYRGLSHPSSSS
ncbi:MAG TPA: DNA-3-methyladenine glycosylase I [Thermodesulfovibrionales bacterium]|nr:DNA-3-methyladenine glycosylase I [Thermodesulfovibrionales bacterium]